ncbi:vacuolar protein sorting-associated protein 13D-like isoform X2 [Gigantopelta aegis]|uniref:vacuolar protein sorting-associated protein 13D-like isoform X2 n=1 Tax=Gigantopelta aegis TaxID=1735272 RepID=UPI001B88C7B3|nr:vacuolar protein sorting-associated protein 13D-like isoform X2 [Gigantopelta aegis]
MLEGLAAWVLNTYVGEYVENLNTDQLSIALLQGAVELENLPLKKDALRSLDIPLEVKSGVIGKITLQIPISRLRSEPWVISIEKIYLVAGPLTELKHDEQKEKDQEKNYKQEMLDALEAKWKVLKQGKQSELTSTSWFSYGASMLANVLENIQLIVSDIHLRYEDEHLNPSCPFACGVTIKKLSAQSTDGSWTPSFVHSTSSDMMFKLADLQHFSMYCDTNTTMLGDLPLTELMDAMQRDMFVSTLDNNFKEHGNILSPINAQAKVTRRTSVLPLRSPTSPRINIDISLDKIDFTLTSEQYQCLMFWQSEFERHGLRRLYRKHRPMITIKENPRSWWQFAINCHLVQIQDRNRRLTKEFILKRVHDSVVYTRLYLQSLTEDTLTSSVLAEKAQLEDELDFEELKILREAVLSKLYKENKLPVARKSPSPQDQVVSTEKEQPGLFRLWFPGWSGWSQASAKPTENSVDQEVCEKTPDPVPETESTDPVKIEQEIMDVIMDSTENSSFLRKDTVFAHFTFSLAKGSFALLEIKDHVPVPLVELQCSTISMEFESRPRTSAMKFKLAVGCLYLQDKATKGCVFPYVVAPQTHDLSKQPFSMSPRNQSSTETSPPKTPEELGSDWKFFELLYEKNPPSSFFRYGISIKTRPLDIVYSPMFLNSLHGFFSSVRQARKAYRSRASAWKFEKLKKQSPDQLMETLDQLLKAEGTTIRWDIKLDISAPKLIIPENYCDVSSNMVVIDLGKFCFQTISSRTLGKSSSSDTKEDEDDFHTPLSTPPNEVNSSYSLNVPESNNTNMSRETSNTSLSALSSTAFHDHLYERYNIELTDMQVLLGRPQDNWRHAYSRVSSRLHVIDRFTISLQLERRLVVTSDPQWPKMTMAGNLPAFTFHLNERKIQAIDVCVKILSSSSTSETGFVENISTASLESEMSEDARPVLESDNIVKSGKEEIDNKLIVFQFLIQSLSVEVHSQDQALVELRISGVQADVSKKPHNTSLKLTVHSLLVVDALQSYGTDFELLIASHKNLVLDSKSGSMRGSGATSPLSPGSPTSPEDCTDFQFHASQSMQEKLFNAFRKVSSSGSDSNLTGEDPEKLNLQDMPPTAVQPEALIILEYEIVHTDATNPDKTSDGLQIVNLQFNNLDIIANQETLVEVLSFLKRTFPSLSTKNQRKSTAQVQLVDQDLPKKDRKVIVTSIFKRLNIMLPRFIEKDGRKTGKKIATATLTTAKIHASLEEGWMVEGSLGGLHLNDVSPEATQYQQVFSLGETQWDQPDCLVSPVTFPSAMYQTARDDTMFEETPANTKQACSFTVSKNYCDPEIESVFHKMHVSSDEILANFDMASLYYTHCPLFLQELMDGLSEFQEYMSSFASTVGKAASEMARGMVGALDSHEMSFALRKDISMGDFADGVMFDDVYGSQTSLDANISGPVIRVRARMETPIIVLPRTPTSSHVLLAHLGEITVTNVDHSEQEGDSVRDQTHTIHISLRNMNLYSVDLTETTFSGSLGTSVNSFSQVPRIPILYDTAVELDIATKTVDFPFINPEGFQNPSSMSRSPNKPLQASLSNAVLDVAVKISSPLKLVLSKEVYEQILQTLDNLAYNEDDYVSVPNDPVSNTDSTNNASSSSMDQSQFSTDTAMHESTIQEGFYAKHIKFEVPLFQVELRWNFGEGEQGLVDLKLHDFSVQYTKDNKYSTRMQIRLNSMLMDDLLELPDSAHRQIIMSESSRNRRGFDWQSKKFLSSSCPNSTIITPDPLMPHSLPSSFHKEPPKQSYIPQNIGAFASFTRSLRTKTDGGGYPQTPPPSPMVEEGIETRQETEDLVYIDVVLIDRKSSEYVNKYNKTNRFIDIHFNCLEATINLQTWVVLLDFLGMGAKIHNSDDDPSDLSPVEPSKQLEDEEEIINSEINFAVESFCLVLNKPDYELARAGVHKLQTHISLHDSNMSVKGQLGNLSLVDQSPHGELYRERFVTVGRQALEFDLFKHGIPDFQLEREYDICLKLRMSSVRYIHTNRFQSEVVAFCQNFLQLQDVLGRMRAASAGKKVSDKATHGTRMQLDIEAGSPIILIPHSSRTDDVLVVDLGRLRITNSFTFDGEEGTSTFQAAAKHKKDRCRAKYSQTERKTDTHKAMTESTFDQYFPPQTHGDLMSQSIYGSLDHDVRDSTYDEQYSYVQTVADIQSPEREGTSVDPNDVFNLPVSGDVYEMARQRQASICSSVSDFQASEDYRCLLDMWSLTLTDIDLYAARRVNKKLYSGGDVTRDMEFSSCMVQREPVPLLREKCQLDLHIEHNLDGDISHTAPDWRLAGRLSSLYAHLDLAQYKLVRGILGHNLGEQIEEFTRPLMTELQDPRNHTVLSGAAWKCISIVVDLHNVTVELLMTHDQGPENPEVSLARVDFISSQLSYDSFSDQTKDIDLVSQEIVVVDTRFKTKPMNSRPNVFVNILQPLTEQQSKVDLQLEMHFRSSKDCTQFTILLNNMKLMCIFDWLLSMQEFLLTDAENPFEAEEQEKNVHQEPRVRHSSGTSLGRTQSPLNVTRGIVTKRGPFVEQVNVPFELRLNINDTQFVVVEDAASLDTSAVILKTTAVLTYQPRASDKVMRCSLQRIEVFSCCLMSEDDTALSIIDPLSISIELNANPAPALRPAPSCGLLEAAEAAERKLLLEVNFQTLNLRLSYHDMMLFLSILNSLPQQAMKAQQRHSQFPGMDTSVHQESCIKTLMDLGFVRENCKKALTMCNENTDTAAVWLTTNCTYQPASETKQNFEITHAELKAHCICICLIDDCGDSDIPLAEISFSGVQFNQQLLPRMSGQLQSYVTAEYYNRNLSGWEPFIETWKFSSHWKQHEEPVKCLNVHIETEVKEVINVNLTSTLIEQYNQTKGSWTADYWKQKSREDAKTKRADLTSSGSSESIRMLRRRLPFIPYMIYNETGSNLWFLTATTTPTSEPSDGLKAKTTSQQLDSAYIKASDWKKVKPGECKPFYFHQREKYRHQKTHEMHINQLVVTVDGWQRLSAVSVDKVGVYFRHAEPAAKSTMSHRDTVHPARVVFDVQQEGNARKLITVRSAMMIVNRLDSPLEIKLEATNESGQYQIMNLQQGGQVPIPLQNVYDRIWARPKDRQVHFCDRPLHWQHVVKAREYNDGMRKCESVLAGNVYRFCVSVCREQYPEDAPTKKTDLPRGVPSISHPPLPGHTITLLPPLTISNLLPVEIHYYFQHTPLTGNLKAGKQALLHGADLSEDLYFGVQMENFPQCRELRIPSNTNNYKVKLRLMDSHAKNRMLELIVRINTYKGGSLKLSVLCPYWLVNKAGVPLVFRQDGAPTEAAGQGEEHEMARSVSPLLFSFSDKESPFLCTMRVGKKVHGLESLPQWCPRFPLDRGIGMRQLNVTPRDKNRPDWVYVIGIEVSPGRGRYRDTTIVTFAPRFIIDNQSHHKLLIAQRHNTLEQKFAGVADHLVALPDCKIAFHWPRTDFDQLLCVQMDKPGCHWSGGFFIDKVSSFHINMRNNDSDCLLLKVEVLLQGPTFFIIFADGDVMPPPFRLDNHSEVPILFYQTGTTEDCLRKQLKPHSSVPYAWDEPTMSPQLTLKIPGGTSATYNLNKLEEGPQLCYENFIYIAATHTFSRNYTGSYRELVLDCVHDNNLVFKRKETGKRSQMWRMTGDGMLEHEGSMPPRDPRNSKATTAQGLVLDIADIAPQPGRCVPLKLRKRDARRKSTQTWKFSEAGTLTCSAGMLCVQAVGGSSGLQEGAVVVLGPRPGLPRNFDEPPSPEHRGHTPPHMQISRQKLRPGSGCLAVKVLMEGPIRILQINDIQHTTIVRRRLEEIEDWEVYEQSGTPPRELQSSPDNADIQNIEVEINLRGGIGISVVNSLPEELLYITLGTISMTFSSEADLMTMDGQVGLLQIDNQMFGAQRSVLLFVTPQTRSDVADNTPALHITAHKVRSAKWNAEIFKHLIVSTKKMTVHLEEKLLWKLLQFAGYNKPEDDMKKMEESCDTHRALSASSVLAKRYYFGALKLNTNRITLSMVTSSKLPPDLKAIKHAQSMTLIAFEDAKVDLDPFVRLHPFESSAFLLNEIMIHYTQELKSQAAKILGSVDFLGNPLGLFNDVTEGISGLIKDGNVGGLLKNVAHGVSNSAAKVASSISDGAGTISMDDQYNQTREQLRQQGGRSSGHIIAGMKGLGYGIFGGLTGVFTQPIEGAREDGVEGFLKGVGKGVIGTVTKPVSGVFDFTSALANAVRDSSRSSSRQNPPRIRPQRCCYGPGGLLPAYSRQQAEAQQLLFSINDNDYTECVIAMDQLRWGSGGNGDRKRLSMYALITSKQVYFLGSQDHDIVLNILYEDLVYCRSFKENRGDGSAHELSYYIELTTKADGAASLDSLKHPRVRCEKASIAQKVVQEINYAKNMYDEKVQTLQPSVTNDELDM